jgi:hypothetical protein
MDIRLGSLPCQKEALARPGDGSHCLMDSWLLGFETDLQRLIADLDAVLNVTGPLCSMELNPTGEMLFSDCEGRLLLFHSGHAISGDPPMDNPPRMGPCVQRI